MNVTVVGVGDSCVDIYLSIPHIPSWDEKVLAKKTFVHPGGMVANFLTVLTRLGTRCGFLSAVGDDEFGRMLIDDLKKTGVDVSRIQIKENARTSLCVVLLDKSGEKALVVEPPSAIVGKSFDSEEGYISAARHLHTAGTDFESSLNAASLAKKSGLTVSLDLESSTAKAGLPGIRSLLRYVDILFLNSKSLEWTVGGHLSMVERAKKLLKMGPGTVAVTMGGKGAFTITAQRKITVPPYSVKIEDSTGAGDTFSAAFIHGFLHGWSLEKTSVFAGAAAAISLTKIGARSAPASEAEVKTFITHHESKLTASDSL